MSKKKGAKGRKALGRGLSALLPDPAHDTPQPAPTLHTPKAESGQGLLEVEVERIRPGIQPRKTFAQNSLVELADSIKKQGLLQPLLVRQSNSRFVLIAGERRWRAAKLAGLHTVPVVVKEATEAQAFELALVENVQRQDLNPIEEAEAYRRLIDEYAYTQEQAAARVGRDRSTVTNALRLLRLPAAVRRLVADGALSGGHARALLSLSDPKQIKALADRIVRQGLSVRQTEKLVQSPKKKKKATQSEPVKTAAVRDLEERLQRSMKTRVRLRDRGKGNGRIEIEYNSLDELDRLLDVLLR
jgi:ParB family chromosome partitioning protein